MGTTGLLHWDRSLQGYGETLMATNTVDGDRPETVTASVASSAGEASSNRGPRSLFFATACQSSSTSVTPSPSVGPDGVAVTGCRTRSGCARSAGSEIAQWLRATIEHSSPFTIVCSTWARCRSQPPTAS